MGEAFPASKPWVLRVRANAFESMTTSEHEDWLKAIRCGPEDLALFTWRPPQVVKGWGPPILVQLYPKALKGMAQPPP